MGDESYGVDEVPYGVGSGKMIENEPQEPKGFLGKFVNNAWNGIKTGASKFGKWIGDSGIGKAGKWVWKNKVPIMSTVGGALQGVGVITGNPALAGVGKGLSIAAGAIKAGEAKKALEKTIAERQPNPYGDQSLTYSDMPRIHYSRKPAAYKIYQNPNIPALLNEGGPPMPSYHKKYVDEVERKNARLKHQKKYRAKKKLKK